MTMRPNVLRMLAWVAGVSALVAMFVFFRPIGIGALIRSLGFSGISIWIVLTVIARIVLGETTIAPMAAMGYRLKRTEAFWIGWLRTFANQIMPVSGVVAYAHAVRARTNISWSEFAAMATPQFVLAATALGTIGLLAVAVNTGSLGSSSVLIALVYLGVIVASLAVTRSAAWIIDVLPAQLSKRARQTSTALRKIATTRGLIIRLVLYHAIVILLRGLRVWLLFAAVGVSLSWNEALLVVAIAESTLLIQVTPGGLGLREGAIVGGAALVGVPASIAAGVAILDRVLVVALIALLTPPSIAVLSRSSIE